MSLRLGHFVPFLMFEMCDLPPPAPSCGCQPCAGPRAAVTADPLLMSTVLSGFWKRLTLQPKLFPEKKDSLRRARICSEAGRCSGSPRRSCRSGQPGGPLSPVTGTSCRGRRWAPALRGRTARSPHGGSAPPALSPGGEPRPGHQAASPAPAGFPSFLNQFLGVVHSLRSLEPSDLYYVHLNLHINHVKQTFFSFFPPSILL